MAIKSPKESVYYYECYNGRFRLSYFIPPKVLKGMAKDLSIERSAVDDFPDGVDLVCTKGSFDAFERTYGIRPGIDPEVMREVFYSVYSTTHNWKKFRGSGYILAEELERHVDKVERAVKKQKAGMRKLKPLGEAPTPQDLIDRRRHLAARQKKVHVFLEELEVKEVDRTRSMAEQKFPRPALSKGDEPMVVFARVHQKRFRRR